MEICRMNQILSVRVKVQDLYETMPDTYLEVGDGILHPISYQIGRNLNKPLNNSGLYLCCNGYTFANYGIPNRSLILAINHESINTLNELVKVVQGVKDGERVVVQYLVGGQKRVGSLILNRDLFPVRMYKRNDSLGLFEQVPLPSVAITESLPVTHSSSSSSSSISSGCQSVYAPLRMHFNHQPHEQIYTSLVQIHCQIPFIINGITQSSTSGIGLIVDGMNGLIVCDSKTVPLGMCELEVVFSNHRCTSAEVVFRHPLHYFTFLKYDPLHIGVIHTPRMRYMPHSLQNQHQHQSVLLALCLSNQYEPFIKHVSIGSVNVFKHALGMPPSERMRNTEVLFMEEVIECLGGVLIDPNCDSVIALYFPISSGGRVGGLDGSSGTVEYVGLPMDYILPYLQTYHLNQTVQVFNPELSPITFSEAMHLGLTNDWIQRLSHTQSQSGGRVGGFDSRAGGLGGVGVGGKHTVLQVERRFPAVCEGDMELEEGDLLLSVNGVYPTRILDIHSIVWTKHHSRTLTTHHSNTRASGGTRSNTDEEDWEILVWRHGKEQLLLYKPYTIPLDTQTEFIISFNGLLMQEIYMAAKERITDLSVLGMTSGLGVGGRVGGLDSGAGVGAGVGGVGAGVEGLPYISCVMKGSPGECSGIGAGWFIIAIEGCSLLTPSHTTTNTPTSTTTTNNNEQWKQFPKFAQNFFTVLKTVGGSRKKVLRVQVMNRDGIRRVYSMTQDSLYWPLWYVFKGKRFEMTFSE